MSTLSLPGDLTPPAEEVEGKGEEEETDDDLSNDERNKIQVLLA